MDRIPQILIVQHLWYFCFIPLKTNKERRSDESVQTIIVVLDPTKMQNPTIDLAYTIPEKVETFFPKIIFGNGYEYIKVGRKDLMAIWLETEDAAQNWKMVLELFEKQKILHNDLSFCSEIYISEQEEANLEDCSKVYPI